MVSSVNYHSSLQDRGICPGSYQKQKQNKNPHPNTQAKNHQKPQNNKLESYKQFQRGEV